MLYYVLRIGVSAALIVAVSEIAKRSTVLAAILASLPLTSILAFVWMQIDGDAPEKIAELSGQIFWLVIPSLTLFLLLPVLLKNGFGFWASLAVSSLATAACYGALMFVLRKAGVNV